MRAAAAFCVLTLALTWPLVRAPAAAIPHDAGDPVLNTWLLWWSTRAWPLSDQWWDAPMFYPARNVMALSELLIGLLPITAPVQWLSGSPLLAYNVAFLLSFPLSALAAYALALELTGRRDAAWFAGLAFAFGPYRMHQLAHLQVLSYYWAPVVLLALHRYLRTRRRGWLALFAGAWLVQGLVNGYAIFHVSVLVALWLIWFVRTDRAALPILAAWAVAALPLVPVLVKYRAVHEQLHLARDINEIKRLSADLASFASAPPELAVWGGRLAESRLETALFPGLTLVLVGGVAVLMAYRRRRTTPGRWPPDRILAAATAAGALLVAISALVLGPWRIGSILTVSNFHKPFSIAMLATAIVLVRGERFLRAWRRRSTAMFYVVAVVAMYVLALGPSPTFLGRDLLYEPPYAWLMRLPGFDALRSPARFAMLALLCQAVLLALVVARWAPRTGIQKMVLAGALTVGLLADGWIRLHLEPAPPPPPALGGASAMIEMPPGGPGVDFPALYRAMEHRLPLANGYSGYFPPHYPALVHAIDRGLVAAVEELATTGPIAVVIDRGRGAGQDIENRLSALPSATRLATGAGWTAFTITPLPRRSAPLGRRIPTGHVSTNRQPHDAPRMADGRLDSGWGSGVPQAGGEEVIVDLGSPQAAASVVLAMGPFAFAFPRALSIDVSDDGAVWREAWSGETAVLTLRAALAQPERVSTTFPLRQQPMPVRFIRLRQTGSDRTVPWWIAEIEVYGAP